LTSAATGEVRTVSTNDNGEYAISSLPAGVYQLKVEMTSFLNHLERIELLVNQEQRRNVTLTLAGPEPSVLEINSTNEAQLKKDSSALGTVIENRQVTGLPLDGRNFYEPNPLNPAQAARPLEPAGSVHRSFCHRAAGR